MLLDLHSTNSAIGVTRLGFLKGIGDRYSFKVNFAVALFLGNFLIHHLVTLSAINVKNIKFIGR